MPDKARKVCVVTGGGSGLGRVVARRLAERCAVAIGDVNCDGEINGFDVEPFLVALFARRRRSR